MDTQMPSARKDRMPTCGNGARTRFAIFLFRVASSRGYSNRWEWSNPLSLAPATKPCLNNRTGASLSWGFPTKPRRHDSEKDLHDRRVGRRQNEPDREICPQHVLG